MWLDVLIYTVMVLNGEHTLESQYITSPCWLEIRVMAKADVLWRGCGGGRCGGGCSFPRGLPERQRTTGFSIKQPLALITASPISEKSPPRDWSMSTGSFKADAHIAQNKEQRYFPEGSAVTLYNKKDYLCSTLHNKARKEQTCLPFFWMHYCRSNFATNQSSVVLMMVTVATYWKTHMCKFFGSWNKFIRWTWAIKSLAGRVANVCGHIELWVASPSANFNTRLNMQHFHTVGQETLTIGRPQFPWRPQSPFPPEEV